MFPQPSYLMYRCVMSLAIRFQDVANGDNIQYYINLIVHIYSNLNNYYIH